MFYANEFSEPEAAQICLMLPYAMPGRDVLSDKSVKIFGGYVLFFYLDCEHSASDVNTDKIRADFVRYGHGRTNRTVRPCVDVGHHPNLLPFCERLPEQAVYLRETGVVHNVRKDDGFSVFSCNF